MTGTVERASVEWGPLRLGLVLAACLFLAHVGVWRPVRGLLVEHVAGPAVAAIATERAATMEVASFPEGRFIDVVRPDGTSVFWRMPAAFQYLFAGLLLVAAFPRRRYWLDLWVLHVMLGVVAFGAFFVGVGWHEAGFAVSEFVRIYAMPGASIVALALAFVPVLRTGRESPPSALRTG